MEKVTLNGRIRLTLKPLMDDMPIVAAIQASPSPPHCTMLGYVVLEKPKRRDETAEMKERRNLKSTRVLTTHSLGAVMTALKST